MNYYELLNQYISKSGLSHRELSRRCKELGKSVSQAYISQLVRGDVPPPSEDVNKIIATVVNGDSEKLNWFGYIEKAPTGFKKILSQLGEEIIPAGKRLLAEYPMFFSYSPDEVKKIEHTDVYRNFIGTYRSSVINTRFSGIELPDDKNNLTELYDQHDKKSVPEITTLHDAYLYDAKKAINSRLNNTNDQVQIRGAILTAFTALELRLNEVLLQAIVNEGNARDFGYSYLHKLSLESKLMISLKEQLNYAIEEEDFYKDLMWSISLRSRILHGALMEEVFTDQVKKIIETIEKLLYSVEEIANKYGIE
ncbi:helix-turn-helix domain-containing protein [Radiobacillus sp. PE A8.2]|uniref:helix-turn-helix domain-containing protein n=1 Tax=Radiobacillus sp. PE A8.2 TaxID=3380349 RepID=UPI00388F2EB3